MTSPSDWAVGSDGSAVAPPGATELPRFDRVERAVHWTNATLFLVLLLTGFTLWGFPGTTWVGRRELVKSIHVWVGYFLPVPVLIGLALGPLARQLRDDFHRLGRWTRDDQRWWSRRKRASVRLGKFNPGQKLNAAFIGAALIVMPITGLMLKFPDPFPNTWRRGATATHDWFAFGLLLAIVGHILFALSDRDALRGMVRGRVRAKWARRERPRWYAEVTGDYSDELPPLRRTTRSVRATARR
jgi:formate dehydrogenase subunit gamma